MRRVNESEGVRNMSAPTERAILAGGCFWGVQDLLRRYPGIISTRVGYSGGDVRNATYRNHGTHAEAIEIIFNPKVISYRTLLEFFFQIHDPTTLNRQGNDRGSSYRSAIFYVGDEQKRIAEDTIEDVNASGLWPGKVVTELEPAGDFLSGTLPRWIYLSFYPAGMEAPGSGNRETGIDLSGSEQRIDACLGCTFFGKIHLKRRSTFCS
jgi:peptide-methionine (S)-S-oxide reductase